MAQTFIQIKIITSNPGDCATDRAAARTQGLVKVESVGGRADPRLGARPRRMCSGAAACSCRVCGVFTSVSHFAVRTRSKDDKVLLLLEQLL